MLSQPGVGFGESQVASPGPGTGDVVGHPAQAPVLFHPAEVSNQVVTNGIGGRPLENDSNRLPTNEQIYRLT
jgi:hypothetical protein